MINLRLNADESSKLIVLLARYGLHEQTLKDIDSLKNLGNRAYDMDVEKQLPMRREREKQLSGVSVAAVKVQILDELNKNYRQLDELKKIAGVKPKGEVFLKNYAGAGARRYSKTPIREFLVDAHDMALAACATPCFIASPDTVSMYLPVSYKFDVVIFDEASQVRDIKAAAVLGRARSIVVAGDLKQLPPTSFFSSYYHEEEDDENQEYEEEDDDSLLAKTRDACNRNLMHEVTLLWHYRSRHESLIKFSAEKFYDTDSGDPELSLKWFPASGRDGENCGEGVVLHRIEGEYLAGGKNADTAQKSVELAMECIKKGKKVGIITFSQQQVTSIYEILFSPKYYEDYKRIDVDDPETGFFVKNLESVQGDERDVIILDFPYGKDSDGKFSMNLGPQLTNSKVARRRINVAITRARKEMHVVTTVKSSDFNVAKESSGLALIRDFFEYGEKEHGVRSGDTTGLVLKERGEQNTVTVIDNGEDSPFEAQVREYVKETLIKIGRTDLEIHTQIGCVGYRIDLAIYDPSRQKYILGIECDGAQYHSSRHARTRDIIRHNNISALGWTLDHVWGGKWFGLRSVENEKNKLADKIRQAAET